MKPIIGLTAGHHQDESVINDCYQKAVLNHGGIPLLLPLEIKKEEMNQLINLCDGFIFTGGGDIDPAYFDEEPDQHCGEISPIRDKMEMPFMGLVGKANKPVLAICRGAQVMNVAFGGSLYQDLPSGYKGLKPLNHRPQAPYSHPVHGVEVKEGSLLHTILGVDALRVNSIHHQGFKRLGEGIKAVAWAPCGLVEAIEKEDHPFFLGVQWHPEKMSGDEPSQKIFKAFIQAVKTNK